RQRDLIGNGRYGRFEIHPVGVAAEQVELPCGLVVDLRHARQLRQPVLAPVVAIRELRSRVVAEMREGAAVEERAVVDDARIVRRVAEAAIPELDGEIE